MDFIVALPFSKFRKEVYNAILVIVDRYSKIARFIRCSSDIIAL